MHTLQIKIGCEVILKQGNTILLGKRKNCFGEGTWALPGGHLEFGETIIHAARREMKEELGIEVAHLTLVAVSENISAESHYLHCTFLVEEYGGKIQCMEPDLCYEWRFFPLTDLPQPFFVPHKRIIETYLDGSIYLPKKQLYFNE